MMKYINTNLSEKHVAEGLWNYFDFLKYKMDLIFSITHYFVIRITGNLVTSAKNDLFMPYLFICNTPNTNKP